MRVKDSVSNKGLATVVGSTALISQLLFDYLALRHIWTSLSWIRAVEHYTIPLD